MPLQQAQPRIEEQILLDRQAEALAELDAEIAERAQVGNIDQFIQYTMEVLYRRYNKS